jgi:hypothetical protein
MSEYATLREVPSTPLCQTKAVSSGKRNRFTEISRVLRCVILSGYFVIIDRPDVVVDAITRVVNAVRDKAKLARSGRLVRLFHDLTSALVVAEPRKL